MEGMIPWPRSRYTSRYEPAELDRIAWKIIEELQLNARISWAELGRRLGVTTPAVGRRARRQEKLGVIRGFHAGISLKRRGMPLLIFVRWAMAIPEWLVRKIARQVK